MIGAQKWVTIPALYDQTEGNHTAGEDNEDSHVYKLSRSLIRFSVEVT